MKETMKTFRNCILALALSLIGFAAIPDAYAQAAQPAAPTSAAVPQSTVKALQEALNKRGIAVPVDGVLSEATRAAVRKFQSQHHLPATGEADKPTLDKLGVVAQQGAASGTESTVGQAPSSTGSSMMSQGPMMSSQGSMSPGQRAAGMPGAPMMQGMMQMMQGMMGVMKGQMGGGPMASEPESGPAPGGRMQGQTTQDMMMGMMQTMQGMMGMMQAQMQPGQAQAGPMGPGRMFQERAERRQDGMMNCAMDSRADRTSGPAMMQMMQGMMQMMNMMHRQMKSGQDR